MRSPAGSPGEPARRPLRHGSRRRHCGWRSALDGFAYIAPATLDELAQALGESPAPVVLAGGTDLVPSLREGRVRPSLVVDIKRLPEATTVSPLPDGGLELGAAVSCAALTRGHGVAQAYPGLVDALALIGGVQIRNRASIGGNLCNASPAADIPPALIAHGASCRVLGPRGERCVAAEDFALGPGRTCLAPDEVLLSVRLPAPAPGLGAAYLRFTPRAGMDIAVAGVAVAVTVSADAPDQVSALVLGLGAVAPRPLRLDGRQLGVVGAQVDDALVDRIAAGARAAARPIGDVRGGVAQRVHLCGVLTARATRKALERARASLAAGDSR
jgi:carbon-monoxide dehydrogenase medium subunit